MVRRTVIPDEIRGFKIIKDLGVQQKGRNRKVIASCAVCSKEFEVVWRNLYHQNSCGCTRYKLEPLPEFINGFKIVKDLGTILISGTKKKRRVIAECKICGEDFEATASTLNYQEACSCSHNLPEDVKRHQRLIQIYWGMRARCGNPNAQNYPRYGGRGIYVCKEWIDDKILFVRWALSNGYAENLTIDRIDNEKGYSPDNCRWATNSEQQRNKREK